VKLARMKREAAWEGMVGVKVLPRVLWSFGEAQLASCSRGDDVMSSRVLQRQLDFIGRTTFGLYSRANVVCELL
jgi:hypothetical protein